jgi:hypothetical protein
MKKKRNSDSSSKAKIRELRSSIFEKKSTPEVFTPVYSFNYPKSLKINSCVIGPFLTEKENDKTV